MGLCVLPLLRSQGHADVSLFPLAAPGLRVPVWGCLRLDDVCLHCGHDIQHHLPHHRPFW